MSTTTSHRGNGNPLRPSRKNRRRQHADAVQRMAQAAAKAREERAS